MNDSVFELILLLIIKDNALIINKIKETDSPNRTAEELNHEIIHPFLK